MVQIMLYMCEGKVLMDMSFSFKNKYHYTYPNTYILPPSYPTFYVLSGMTSFGFVEAHLPVELGKVREGSLANEGTSLRGIDNNFLFLGVCVCVCITGKFGVRKV